MVKPVDSLIEDFAKAGATLITFHPEASDHVDRSLELVKSFGCKTGLVLNPETSLDSLDSCWDRLDMVLLMSVNPGFGGQDFIPSVLDKISVLRKTIDQKKLNIRLEVDGGIKLDNITEVANAGADTFVSGSGIFGEKSYQDVISKMRQSLN